MTLLDGEGARVSKSPARYVLVSVMVSLLRLRGLGLGLASSFCVSLLSTNSRIVGRRCGWAVTMSFRYWMSCGDVSS